MPQPNLKVTIEKLNKIFITSYPIEAARKFETMTPSAAANILSKHPICDVSCVFSFITPGIGKLILLLLPKTMACELLMHLEPNYVAILLRLLNKKQQDAYLRNLDQSISREIKEILGYPQNTAGAMMEASFVGFNKNASVKDILLFFQQQKLDKVDHILLLNDQLELVGKINVGRLVLADKNLKLFSLSEPVSVSFSALDSREKVIKVFEKTKLDFVPVLDANNRVIGVIQSYMLIEAIKEDIVSDIQTMVGANKEESALSSSFFSVRKRLPWMEINLLTAFLAAAVVGIFEETIAKYTALAVLLPVVAGQSGNAGAQALAITMRSLILREITTNQWLKIALKEFNTGLMNGILIALTCAVAVFIWSKNIGLSLVITLSMIVSMIIASVAGALVPIVLKKLRQDPAQSSSIILTTITDVAGFMSFLGIATSLHRFLL